MQLGYSVTSFSGDDVTFDGKFYSAGGVSVNQLGAESVVVRPMSDTYATETVSGLARARELE